MDDARGAVFRHGIARVREWPMWSLSRPLLALWSVVLCGYLAWIGDRAAYFHFRLPDLVLFAALLACGAFSVEMSRRASEPSGVVKDVYAVWELPVVFLLPCLYALIIPAFRLTLTQLRVRQAPGYKRVYTAAAIGSGYGCARFIYTTLLPSGVDPKAYLWNHTAMWLVAAGVAAVSQWVINQVLILAAVKLENPAARIRDELLARETLHNDATELCAALLVAVGMTISDLTLIVALPLATLLQRSFRHAQLLSEARADSKTGLLNAATWEREASAEVARAVRTKTPLAVALLDLDRFKQINDTYGHLVGDEVLRAIADTMTGVLRDYDLAGRFGGEEFVMLLPQTRATDALRIAERVRSHIARLPIGAAGGERVPVTVSIGVAALDAGSRRELTELLAAADAALYRAKASGRDQVQMISTSRGLSAVRPSDYPGAAFGGVWDADEAPLSPPLGSRLPVTPRSAGTVPSAGAVPASGARAGSTSLTRASALAGGRPDANEAQLPAGDDDDDGTASSAASSALAV
ncbi:MAG TPA: GGDEF domain-containing protein [Trebonia sp.]|nr:GGDEF domain-containing protein [Trebonia sp.]